jgi:K+-transporting ATPase ATPase C chain
MLQQLRIATSVLIVLTVFTGGIYPWLVTIIAQAAFPAQANGSLLHQEGRVSGSALIGQPFSRPEYFWGRLSATTSVPYNAAASSGSNFGPLNPGLKAAAEARILALRAAGSSTEAIPVELITASASGLDPHISPKAAEFQVQRVAAARKMKVESVRDLVRRFTESRQLGLLGEPRVNVLLLNMALDQRIVE